MFFVKSLNSTFDLVINLILYFSKSSLFFYLPYVLRKLVRVYFYQTSYDCYAYMYTGHNSFPHDFSWLQDINTENIDSYLLTPLSRFHHNKFHTGKLMDKFFTSFCNY